MVLPDPRPKATDRRVRRPIPPFRVVRPRRRRPGDRAIYYSSTTVRGIANGFSSANSAAIGGTNPGIGTNVDANIGQFLPTAYSGVLGGGIASCSDRRTAAHDHSLACDTLERPASHRGWPCARGGMGILPRSCWYAAIRGR